MNMNTIKTLLLTPIALLMLAGVGHSQVVGAVGGFTLGTSGSFTDDSLTLPSTMYVSLSSGTLSSEMTGSAITLDSNMISLPLTSSISGFLSFSSPGILSTTGDNNRFVFNLTSLTETNYFSQTSGADFTAGGTLLDTTTESIADASLYISFSGPSSPILSLSVTPEPSTWALIGIGFTALLFIGVRRHRWI